jgi:hypothetical protein
MSKAAAVKKAGRVLIVDDEANMRKTAADP